MSHIRWKLSGGILILSMGGLVAIADMPKETPADPPPLQLESPPIAPVAVPPPTVDQAPTVTPAMPPLELDLPPLSLTPPVEGIAVDEPTVELAPMPRKVMRVESRELPMDVPPVAQSSNILPITPAMSPVADPLALPSQPIPNLEPPTQPEPIAIAPFAPVPEPIAPMMPESPTDALPPPLPHSDMPAIQEVKPIVEHETTLPTIQEARPQAIKTETPLDTKMVDYTLTSQKLKVLVHMGGDRPWFELRDRDEMYLKVICDNIDVHSPKESDKPVSTIRASGNIRYITPGGQGSCNDLTVSPKDGEVEVKGDVRFRYNWGQVRTTLTAETMTFRLDPIRLTEEGSTPRPTRSAEPN